MQNRNRSPQSSTQKPRQNAMSGVPIREEPPAEAYNYDPGPYDAYEAYPPPQKGGGVRTALLIVLAILLVAGGALGAYMVLSMQKDDADGTAEAQTAVTDNASDTQAQTDAQAAQTPLPQADTVALLQQMQYVGDAEISAMTAQQASSFASTIRATQGNVVYAAIFDGGNGVPVLWVATGGSVGLEDTDFLELNKPFGDKIYTGTSGQAQELPWMTVLLSPGTDGVMVKISRDSTKLQFFYLHNGRPDANAYAVGLRNPGGDATYNGVVIGRSDETYFDAFYDQATGGSRPLLSAMSGESDYLDLYGKWISGAQMASLLDQYAAALS